MNLKDCDGDQPELVARLVGDDFGWGNDEDWIPTEEFLRNAYRNDYLLTRDIKRQFKRVQWKRRIEGYQKTII